MPKLEINACVDCPFSKSHSHDKQNNYVGDDMFFIECTHDKQYNGDGFIAKIKNKDNNIYFNCPLEK